MEKIIPILFILVITTSTVLAYNFIDYPSPILIDGKFNGVIVVGDQAPAEDVIVASDIAVSLAYTIFGPAGEEEIDNNPLIIDTMSVGDTKTYTIENLDYELTLNYVDSESASFAVNGMDVNKLKKDETFTLVDGRIIGLADTYILEEPYSATFFLSDQKLKVQISDMDEENVLLASEVNDINLVNSILIGHACDNYLIMEVRRQEEDCELNYEPNTGYIEAYDMPNGKVSIVVTGYSVKDTLNAAKVLISYADFSEVLKGNKLKVAVKNGNLGVTPYQFKNEQQIIQSSDYSELYLKIGLSVIVLVVLFFVFIIPKISVNKKTK